MTPLRRLRPTPEPAPRLADRAVADLQYIRTAMERSGRFTAVPGRAAMGMGAVALVAAHLSAASQPHQPAWLAIWLAAAAVATVLGVAGMTAKARAQRTRVLSGPGRKFVLGLCPPLVAGAVLTIILAQAGLVDALPGTWLLLYGAGVVCGGAYSVAIVPFTGLLFMSLGMSAFLLPPEWGDALMVLGFGGLHLVFGFIVARRHGG